MHPESDRRKTDREISAYEETLLGKFQSQILKLYQILDAAYQAEKKRHEEMSNLMADLVHQVNTPLTNIQMYAGFLLEDKLPKEERKQICEVIDAQVEKLGWFAEGFGKTIRLEDDIRRLFPEKKKVIDIVLSAIDQVSLKAQDHGNEIELSGDQEVCAIYDWRWTGEALFNILKMLLNTGRKNADSCLNNSL